MVLTTASADLGKEVLTILDDFERAIKANESSEDESTIREGFYLIHSN